MTLKRWMVHANVMRFVLLGMVTLTGCDKVSKAESNEANTKATKRSQAVPAAQKAETTTDKALDKNPVSAKKAKARPGKVLVYYFHGDRRCRTCLGIQATIEQTVKERFGKEITSGKLTFHEVNIDQDANKHFIKEFEISFSTMIVVLKRGTRTVKWENCNKVWDYAHDHPALKKYTEERIRAHLGMLKSR